MTEISEKSQIISTWGPAAQFHARNVGPMTRSQIWVHQVPQPTVVLGSTQSPEILNHDWIAHEGYDLVKRRSGGGVVVIDPDTSVWIDVIIAPDHLLWSNDVGQAFMWVGQAWARALASVGVGDLTVHQGPATNPELGRLLCFGSVGFGEVLAGGSKVVGLSQRRTKYGARFQGIAHKAVDPVRLSDAFAADWPPIALLEIGTDFDTDALRHAVVAELDRSLTGNHPAAKAQG